MGLYRGYSRWHNNCAMSVNLGTNVAKELDLLVAPNKTNDNQP